MTVISLAQVKAQLGITTTASDADITAKLPIIDAKVKRHCNNRFNFRFTAAMTDGSTTLTVAPLYNASDSYPSGINNPWSVKDIFNDIEIGMLVEGANIPTGAYITDVYKSGTADNFNTVSDIIYIEISSAVTATASGVTVTGGFNIAYHDIVAHGVQYLIDGTNIYEPTVGSGESLRMGPLSASMSESSQKIDGRSGMPSWFVKGLPNRWAG